MRIPLVKDGSIPLYRQVEQFLIAQIESGVLGPDTQLPPNRKLAEMLGVSRIVVANAYAELESQGFVYSRRGSGTFVAPLYSTNHHETAASDDWPLWQQELYNRAWNAVHQDLDRLLGSVQHPSLISFAERTTPDSLWPVDEFRKMMQVALRGQDFGAALGQGNIAGCRSLRAAIAQLLSNDGIPAHQDNVMITSGSQQALSLVAQVLLQPGDLVLVESPTYNVAIDLCRSLGLRLLGIPVDEQGMDVSRLEEIIQTTPPRLIYTCPTFHNPTGTCMSASRRRQLVALARRYNIPILEDDFIGDMRFEGRAEPALKTLDSGCVIYVGTFSKTLMPSLRIGFIVASGPIFDRLLATKYVTDLSTSELLQQALSEYLTSGRYATYLRRVNQSHRERRDAMVEGLRQHLPSQVRWVTPKGGRYIWLQLPLEWSSDELFRFGAEEGVTFIPGSFFYPGQRPQPSLRLNFAINPPEIIEQGTVRLGRATNRYMKAKL